MIRLFAIIAIGAVLMLGSANAEPARNARMNFVVILIDDLGWADLSCYGSSFYETPHLDALARTGTRFTQAYSACPVCSPTRASIMTGRHPVRLDITDWIPGQKAKTDGQHRFLQIEDRNELPLEEITIAEMLRDAGYQTFFAGKWHLGGEGFLPTDQGFDTNLGGANYGQPPGGYFAPWKNPHLKERHEGESLTERLTQESVSFLKQRDESRPFLLYLSHYDVHTPIHKDEKHFAYFEGKAQKLGENMTPISERRGTSRSQQSDARYASMVAAVDESVGQITAALKEMNLEESTTIIFTSDNGGLCTMKQPGPTCNLPLRSGKGWLYEGGIRVPLIVRSPSITQANSTNETPILSTDFFPTILELAQLAPPPDLALDGGSILPILKGDSIAVNRPLAWHYPHYHGSEWTPGAAFREGDWKLIEFYEDGDAELYNLQSDPGEATNVADTEPDRLKELRANLRAWQSDLNAKMPQENPAWKK